MTSETTILATRNSPLAFWQAETTAAQSQRGALHQVDRPFPLAEGVVLLDRLHEDRALLFR